MCVQNLKFVALPVPEIIAIAVLRWVANPQFWGRGSRRGSGMVPFERALASSYTTSVVTFNLSLRVLLPLLCSSTRTFSHPCPHPSPCSPLVYEERLSEDVGLIVRALPTHVILIHQRHRQTDGRTTCNPTALCTEVHRAVKTWLD